MTVIFGSCSRGAFPVIADRGEIGRFAHLANHVGGLVLRFVVGARHQLGQQAEGDQLDADEQQHHAEQQQRAIGDALVLEQPDVAQVADDQRAEAAGDDADQPEDLQRPRRVVQQELHGREVEDHADGARQSVLGDAGAARAMVDDHLGDRDADLAGDRRQEAVHLAVEAQRLDHLGAKHLQRTAVVVQRHAGRPRDQLVGHHARQAAGDERVFAILAPAADDVVALFDQRDHRGNVARIVLEVAVGGHDQAAARVRDAGGKRRGLAEVAAEANHAQVRIARLQRRQLLERIVRAAVVDDQDLVRAAVLDQRLGQLVIQRLDVRGLVADGYDDRELGIINELEGNQGIIERDRARLRFPFASDGAARRHSGHICRRVCIGVQACRSATTTPRRTSWWRAGSSTA